MRAVVTGAAGFIGSTLVERLLARGDEVLGIDCLTPTYSLATKAANLARAEADPAFTRSDADLRDAPLEPLLDGADVVFHLAARPGVRQSWAEGFADYLAHNVAVTQRLLEAARNTNVGRFVFASSSSVYGNQPRYPVRETDLPQPYSPYGVTKLAAEHLCNAYAQNFTLHTVSLRYFTVYGPRQRPDMSIARLCEAARKNTPFPRYGDGTQVREFTYVDDIVDGTLAAATADVPPGTVCNLAGGSEITLNELIALVSELAGREIAVEERPAAPGDVARNGGAIDRARELLGWEPRVSLRDGIRAQLDEQFAA